MLLIRRLSKQGGSLVLRIPRQLLRAKGWKLGDQVMMTLEKNGVFVRAVDPAALARAEERMAVALAQRVRRA